MVHQHQRPDQFFYGAVFFKHQPSLSFIHQRGDLTHGIRSPLQICSGALLINVLRGRTWRGRSARGHGGSNTRAVRARVERLPVLVVAQDQAAASELLAKRACRCPPRRRHSDAGSPRGCCGRLPASGGLSGDSASCADQLDDLVQRSASCQQELMALGTQLVPLGRNILVEPASERVDIERIARQPVDRREVALVRELGVETPEDLDDAQCRLRDRLGNIAAGRRNSADGGERCRSASSLPRALTTSRHAHRTAQDGCRDMRDSLPRRAFPPDGRTSRAEPRPSGRWSPP